MGLFEAVRSFEGDLLALSTSDNEPLGEWLIVADFSSVTSPVKDCEPVAV